MKRQKDQNEWSVEDIAIIGVTSLAAIIIIAFLILAFASYDAKAHEAPAGWSYDIVCCHDRDCRPLDDGSVKEGPDGYTVPTGEVIPYSSNKVKRSKDEFFHWCTWGGKDDTKTICLYVPSRAF